MKILRWLAGLACLFSASTALAQTEPFSTYVTGLAPVGSVIGTERMFALQTGSPRTITPYQILNAVTGDCAMASPPTIICTKTNGVAFAASATTNTTNAANISSGTLSLTRLALANASIYVGNVSGNPAAAIVSGDCTITNAGILTCTKTSGVAFVASATTDTTNATNISSGTLAGARQSAANLAASGNGGVTGVLPFTNHPTGSLDTILGYWGSTTQSATAVPNCTSGSLQYATASHAWSCSASSGSGNVSTSGTITTNQIGQWASATTLKSTPISGLSLVAVVKVQRFTSSGTYTPSTGLQYAIIECVGGGGGGGGDVTPVGSQSGAGGGGGGGYGKAVASAATIGGSQTVTIGNAGAGGVGNTVGGSGATTSVGSICIANGGGGGGGLSIVASGVGGAAGTGNTVTMAGQAGGVGSYDASYPSSNIISVSGMGGSSFYGNGGQSVFINSAAQGGNPATGFGGGGGGGGDSQSTGPANGGNGTPGLVIITEFTNQ